MYILFKGDSCEPFMEVSDYEFNKLYIPAPVLLLNLSLAISESIVNVGELY